MTFPLEYPKTLKTLNFFGRNGASAIFFDKKMTESSVMGSLLSCNIRKCFKISVIGKAKLELYVDFEMLY